MNRQLMIDQLITVFEDSLDTHDPPEDSLKARLLVQEYLGELNDKTDDQLHKEFQLELN